MNARTTRNRDTEGRIIARRMQRGSLTVEFAVLLPIFLAAMLATFDFGRAWFQNHTVLEAARVGARTGALPDKTVQEVQDAVNAALAVSGFSASQILTANAGAAGKTGDTTEVTVESRFDPLVANFIPSWGNAFTLSQTVRLRHE